jgi:hypothetical protein
MTHQTTTFPSLAAVPGWSLTAVPRRLWQALVMLHDAYGEGLEAARQAQARGIFVE